MEIDQEESQSSQKGVLNPLMQNVGKTLLNEVEKQYREKEEMSDDLLLALHSVFGNSFEKALDLLDSSPSSVVFLRSPSKRCVIQVPGSSGATYTIYPGINYCPCPAYNFHVLGKRSRVTCKHVLVAYLSQLMGKSRQIDVSNEELTKVLCNAAHICDT
ncbi:zinc finger SWIM domain-containing protein 7-like [Ischnura elegans]|uniref:zinc finger SWIM domain-containing protein 7-like n=1 Tax=Ischnura elegans TaxID=197161 RepID=UPI001ED89FFA|nr:zinc finger SWIM domain-containing protein 7-like [Ischnura elegans]